MKRVFSLTVMLMFCFVLVLFLCAFGECASKRGKTFDPVPSKTQQEQVKTETKTIEEPKQEEKPATNSATDNNESTSESHEESEPTSFIGTEMPKNWPEDIPVKSGIEIKSTQEQGSGKEYVAGISGTYFGDPMGLYDFYKNALSSYNLEETRIKSDDGSESITLIGEKDGTEVTVLIQYKGDTVILVAIGYKIK